MLQVLLKALFDLGARLGIRRTFWNRKIQKSIFSKNQKPYNFFVFWATTTIHTFLKSSDKTVIIRQGQKSDIATGKGSGAKFSLYQRTHCTIRIVVYVLRAMHLGIFCGGKHESFNDFVITATAIMQYINRFIVATLGGGGANVVNEK